LTNKNLSVTLIASIVSSGGEGCLVGETSETSGAGAVKQMAQLKTIQISPEVAVSYAGNRCDLFREELSRLSEDQNAASDPMNVAALMRKSAFAGLVAHVLVNEPGKAPKVLIMDGSKTARSLDVSILEVDGIGGAATNIARGSFLTAPGNLPLEYRVASGISNAVVFAAHRSVTGAVSAAVARNGQLFVMFHPTVLSGDQTMRQSGSNSIRISPVSPGERWSVIPLLNRDGRWTPEAGFFVPESQRVYLFARKKAWIAEHYRCTYSDVQCLVKEKIGWRCEPMSL
jgi:hypothetical protein